MRRSPTWLFMSALSLLACKERGAAHPVNAAPSSPTPVALAAVPPPSFEPRTPQLPKLGAPIVVDGKLDDWKDAASVPLRARSQIVQIATGHAWKGQADLSAEMYAGWTDQGIAMAAMVRDDDVVSDKHGADSWQADCVELFVDARAGEHLMSDPYSRGAYQVLVRPPLEGARPEVFVIRNEKLEGLQVAGTLVPGGYTIEVLFPWSAFPDVQPGPGTKVALAFQVDERDKRDNGGRSVTMASPPNPDLWRSAPGLGRWQLVSRPTASMELGPQMLLELPHVITAEPPKTANVELSRALADRVKDIRVTAYAGNTGGPKIASATAPVEKAAAHVTLAPGAWPMGESMVVGEALDPKGDVVGTVGTIVVGIGDALERALADLRAADIAKLAKQKPLEAGAWLGAAAATSRLREDIAQGHAFAVTARAREVRTRIELLQGKPTTPSRADLHDLLVLASQGEAVVEYPSRGMATVTFDYGSIPLGTVVVQDARTAGVVDPGAGLLAEEKTSVSGRPATASTTFVYEESMDAASFDPKTELSLWLPKQGTLWAFAKADLSKVAPRAAVVLAAADPTVAKLARAFADRARVPILSIADAAKQNPVLVAGDPQTASELAGLGRRRVILRTGATKMTVVSDDRTFFVMAPSRDAGQKMVGLVLAGKPITAQDAEAVRASVVAAIGKGIRPAASALSVGDLHMHTFYSDGNPAPVTLMLEAMYTSQDFSVMTDHNTIAGASRMHALLPKMGFAYPQIVGEEVTASYHANAFPLTERIAPDMTPAELTRQVHDRGAFVQWNHPGYPDWGKEYLATGLPPDAFDAWEHLPPRIDAWKKNVPLLTGTTDTHDGTFGQSPERTIVFVDPVDGAILAGELRAKRAVAVLPDGGKLFYGPGVYVTRALAALAEGQGLKEARARRLGAILDKADVVGFVLEGETSPLADN
jgi:hypothetical protein